MAPGETGWAPFALNASGAVGGDSCPCISDAPGAGPQKTIRAAPGFCGLGAGATSLGDHPTCGFLK